MSSHQGGGGVYALAPSLR
jgi:hypothetical protein